MVNKVDLIVENKDFAFNNMIREANIAIELFLNKDRQYNSIKETDYVKDYLQNIYMINNFRRISNSKKITDLELDLLTDALMIN